MAGTYYERLGIAPDASQAAVEAAYRTRLKEVHPDVSDDPGAAERTRRLIEAKRVLTDDHERAVYDRIGHANYTAADGEDSDSAASDDRSEGDDETGSASAEQANGRERRRRRNRRTRAAWNPTAGATIAGGSGRARSDGGTGRVAATDASHLGRRLFPVGPSLVVLFVAFWLYPVLLWGAVEPAFPVGFNLALGGCLLAYVGYFLSLPPVAVAVFGAWTLLLPSGLAAAGVVDGAVWFVAVVGTLVPLVLATVAWAVLRA